MMDRSVRLSWLGWTSVVALAFVLTRSLSAAAQDSGLVDDAIRFRQSVGLEPIATSCPRHSAETSSLPTSSGCLCPSRRLPRSKSVSPYRESRAGS